MTVDTLSKDAILELFAKGDNTELRDLILASLGKLREQAIAIVEDMLFEVDGKFRLKLLEILMEDGGADLISVFVDCIHREKNLLYAKSQILLFRGFDHQEALTALLSIEHQIEPDLKATYQRSLGKLLSRFSEQFYMSEFRAGYGNRRRVKFAVDMMVRSPHEEYVPFLNEQILVNDVGYRLEGVRGLRELGDGTSIDPLFALLTRLRNQRARTLLLQQALNLKNLPVDQFFGGLCQRSGIGWNPNQISLYLEKIKLGEIQDPLEQLLDAYELEPVARKKIKPLLLNILGGQADSAFDAARALNGMAEYLELQGDMIRETAIALGTLAMVHRRDDFLKRLELYLPTEEKGRDGIMIDALSGFRNAESLEMLVDYVNTCSEPDLLARSLDALRGYEVDEVPKGVIKLCENEKNGLLRKQALELLAKWGHAEAVIQKLMDHQSIAVRADAVQTAASYQIDGCYAKMITLLRPGVPDSLLIAVLESLRAFDQPNTAKIAKPFLLPPHTMRVRSSALETLYLAGGPDRFDSIVNTLEQDVSQKLDESLNLFLKLILREDFKTIQPHVMAHRAFWLKLVGNREGDLQLKLIQLLERLDIQEEFEVRPWIKGLNKVLAEFQGSGVSDAERRIGHLVERLEQRARDWNDEIRRRRDLQSLLDGLKARSQFQRVQAIRKLRQIYKPALVADNPAGLKKLVGTVSDMLGRRDENQEILMQTIALAEKIRHPKLNLKLKALTEHRQGNVSDAAEKALQQPVNPDFLKPIRSIFIMDDSRYITKQLSKVLASEGFDVDYENEPEGGLKSLAARSFDLLILDYIMPGMNGVEFLKKARFREIAPDNVVIVTSTRNKEELRPFITGGVDGLLLKPFRMEELMQRIKEISPLK